MSLTDVAAYPSRSSTRRAASTMCARIASDTDGFCASSVGVWVGVGLGRPSRLVGRSTKLFGHPTKPAHELSTPPSLTSARPAHEERLAQRLDLGRPAEVGEAAHQLIRVVQH